MSQHLRNRDDTKLMSNKTTLTLIKKERLLKEILKLKVTLLNSMCY